MTTLFQVTWLVMLLQDLLQMKIGLIGKLDEVLCIASAIYAILLKYRIEKDIKLTKKSIKLTKNELTALKIFAIYLVIGILSSLVFNLVDFKYALLSMIMTVKGYIIYFSFRVIFQYYNIENNILNLTAKALSGFVYILTAISIINIPFGFLDVYDVRFGINTLYLGFSHPTELAFFTIISMSIVLLNNSYENKDDENYKIIIPSVILIVFSGRSKSIAFMIAYILLFYFVQKYKGFKVKYLIYLVPILVFIGLPRIISELGYGARGYLYSGGISIAKDFFPLGSGFGTFGSHISKVYYSPLYHEYGLSNVWGLSEEMSSYITDTYWAMIIGETGFIGILLILLILYFIFVQILKIYSDYKSKVIVFGLVCYTLITSIAEPIYSSNKCAALFLTLAIFITIATFDSKEKIKYS